MGGSRDFEKGGTLYVGHHGWPMKNVLGVRWFKKVKMTLETINILKFSPFLYSIKAFRWNLFQFFQIYQCFDKEREKTLIEQSMRKEKLCYKFALCKTLYFVIIDCFIKPFKMIINHIFYFASSFTAQFLLFQIRMTQEMSKVEIGNGN